jgi:pimeloyl-ACP methyl ester carboxylesterase
VEKCLDRNGCVVSYELVEPATATDRPVVVLMHGFGVDRRMWQPQRAALAAFRVLLLDARGHGRSASCADFSVVAVADDLHAILQAEAIDSPVLVGLSMGGYVVQEYALRYGGASGYVVVGATPLFMPYAAWESASLRASGAMLSAIPWRILKPWMARATVNSAEDRRFIEGLFAEMGRERFLDSWQGIATCLHEEHMQFDAPLLVLYGDGDLTGTIRRHANQWQRLFPGCRVEALPSARHIANLDAPEAFNRLLTEFVESCTHAGTPAARL